MMTMTVHGNAALWLAHFMTFAMFISIRCGTKPGVMDFTPHLSSSFYLQHQNEI